MKPMFLKGVLMDKETGKELLDENGKRVTTGISFVPENEEGTIEMTFELDARRLAGKSVVVFERLYDEEEHLIAKEEDIENADQTILYRKQEIPKNTIVEKPGHNSKEVRKSPKTGDENRMDLWLVMLCAFGIAVVTEIVIYKRRNNNILLLPNKPDGETDVVVHMKEIGNKEYKNIKKDTLIGTTGQNRRLEAIRITGHALHLEAIRINPYGKTIKAKFISKQRMGGLRHDYQRYDLSEP